MRLSRRIFLSLTLLLTWGGLSTTAAQEKKPNIILIMADDLGFETLECNGGQSYKTPRLNAMARRGMRFENAYSTPLCTPSRVQLMTGKYNFRNYIGFGLLDPKETTFAHLLKDAGYVTGVTGKWQLLGLPFEQRDAGNQRGAYPTEAGFDEYCLWQVEERLSRYKDPVVTTQGNRIKEMKGAYGPDIFAKFATDFIERHKDTTFFLYYPMVLVHDPFQPVRGSADFDNAPADQKSNPKYFSEMVSYMDKIAGEILDKVHEVGIDNNTLIIFMGDNGTSPAVESRFRNTTIQGDKGGHTSRATHVPMIAYWPGVIKPGIVNENLIDFTDFVPTLAEVAGVQFPRYFFTDGTSFLAQLKGEANAKARQWVFCSYDPRRGKDRKPGTWIHNKEWKLYTTGQFFNIAKDRDEQNPLFGTQLSSEALAARQQLEHAMNSILNKSATP